MATVVRLVVLIAFVISWSNLVLADSAGPVSAPVYDLAHYAESSGLSMGRLFLCTAVILVVIEAFFFMGLLRTRKHYIWKQYARDRLIRSARSALPGGNQRSPAKP